VLVSVVLAGCVSHPVGPARTFGKYEGKAVTTAESARSTVETVRLAAQTGSEHNAFGPYLSIVVSDAEEAISGVQGTFASIQPPGGPADDLYDELEAILSNASGHIRAVRLAVRRGDLVSLADVAEPLAEDSDRLTSFIEEHG